MAAGSCCAQILWLKQQLEDFGLKISKVPLLCDNTSVINLTKNQIQHSRTKTEVAACVGGIWVD